MIGFHKGHSSLEEKVRRRLSRKVDSGSGGDRPTWPEVSSPYAAQARKGRLYYVLEEEVSSRLMYKIAYVVVTL